MEGTSVKVYIYDLSRGMARAMSTMLIGKQLDGIWHTGIVVYGQEWFFGGMGIESCPPAGTIMGQPDSIEDLGTTHIPFEVFTEYLQELSRTTFKGSCYHLFDHNCNNFSHEVATFLTGRGIPAHITALPQEVLNTPFGQMIKPMLDSMQVTPQGGHHPFSTPIDTTGPSNTLSSSSATNNPPIERKPKELINPVQKFPVRNFADIYKESKSDIRDKCGEETEKIVDEFCEYLAEERPTWSPSPMHIKSLDRVINSDSNNLNNISKSNVLALMQEATLKEDVIQLIRNEPNKVILHWLHSIQHQQEKVQERLVKIATNCSSHTEGRRWLLSSEDWHINKELVCNRKIITSCIISTVLHSDPDIQEGGSALANNIASQKIDDDTALEVGTAVIECLSSTEISITTAENCLRGLEKCLFSNREVVELATVMELNVNKFKTKSSKCDELAQLITSKYLS